MTLPAFMLGAEAVGPKCAAGMGLKASKLPPGSRITVPTTPAQQLRAEIERRNNTTPDLFDNLEPLTHD